MAHGPLLPPFLIIQKHSCSLTRIPRPHTPCPLQHHCNCWQYSQLPETPVKWPRLLLHRCSCSRILSSFPGRDEVLLDSFCTYILENAFASIFLHLRPPAAKSRKSRVPVWARRQPAWSLAGAQLILIVYVEWKVSYFLRLIPCFTIKP